MKVNDIVVSKDRTVKGKVKKIDGDKVLVEIKKTVRGSKKQWYNKNFLSVQSIPPTRKIELGVPAEIKQQNTGGKEK